MKLYILFFLIISGFFFVACDEEEPIVEESGDFAIVIDSLSNEFFKQGDTLVIFGKNFGGKEGKTIIFHGSEISEDGYAQMEDEAILRWEDEEIELLVPAEIVKGRIYINSKLSILFYKFFSPI